MEIVYQKPSGFLKGGKNNFCPGCLHSATFKLVCEVLDEMGLADQCCYVQGVGCDAICNFFIGLDTIGVPHGRACAVATGFKRCNPDTFVLTYQGDGDLASIGLAETMSAANRGENFTVIFVNNGIYGMTGGQMAPTTLLGMKTTTTPNGRRQKYDGGPMHMCELLNDLSGPSYIARVTLSDIQNIMKAKAAVRKAFQNQLDGKGFSFVEFLSNCPTNWGVSPLESLNFVHEKMIKEYPLGVFRDQ